jgi:hypothetical protein
MRIWVEFVPDAPEPQPEQELSTESPSPLDDIRQSLLNHE